MAREIMKEPLYPFIKSNEEIEYEKRISKRRMGMLMMRRMQLDVFKKSIEDQMQSP